MFEIGADGVDLRTLRHRLGLDSGYLSRLVQSLKAQGLIAVTKGRGDGRRRRASLTRKGSAERAAYDRLSDQLAASMLEALDEAERGRLTTAMGEVERLIRAASVEVATEAPDSADARRCLERVLRRARGALRGRLSTSPRTIPPAPTTWPRRRALFVIARLDGDPVGCGGLTRSDKTTGEIKRVWTAPSARGIGVARRVLANARSGRARDGPDARFASTPTGR